MKPFRHTNCTSLEEAAQVFEAHRERARPIAGGTDLLGTLKDNIHPEFPELLVNIKTVSGLDFIDENEAGLRIGALTKLDEIAHHPRIREGYTALAEAAQSVATPQIRRMATVGGNLCQEPRCWYYRHPENAFFCLRKGGKTCGALVGENRYHSIFGALRINNAPCTSACPAAILIAGYMEEIRRGDMGAAARILLAANPLPAITGRICPHFCQEDCSREGLDESVSVREIEHTLGDYILDHGKEYYAPPQQETGKRVAVVGSGPGGLAAAFYLRQQGHAVTVFERTANPGGMLRYIIPAYRLPEEVVERTVRMLKDMGIIFRCGVEIGKDLPFLTLRREFEAVFLAAGAWKRPLLGIEGEDLTIYGLDFLRQIREGFREAPGRRVVIIGGGNVAVDVAISASRLGAQEVTVICLESREEMPALDWELEQALEERVRIINSWGPNRVLTQAQKVRGLELIRCVSVFDDKGRFAPKYDPGTTMTVDADAIIMAVGQRPELDFLPPELFKKAGSLAVDTDTCASGFKGVYLGGDMLRPANVIDAVAEGRKAALSMHAYLMGTEPDDGKPDNRFHFFDPQATALEKAASISRRAVEERRIDTEDCAGLPDSLFSREAARCLNCGCVAVTPSDIGPALISLDAVIQTTRRTLPAGEFFACRIKSSTVLEPGELVTEVRIPRPFPGSRSAYRKYRLRQSIDFPVVSVAVRLAIGAGKIIDARVVLGAAAPLPLRARATEDFLRGRTAAEALDSGPDRLALPAGQAAHLAVQDAVPLAENNHKIQVTRAYVRRAITACLK